MVPGDTINFIITDDFHLYLRLLSRSIESSSDPFNDEKDKPRIKRLRKSTSKSDEISTASPIDYEEL